jgi:hypothetical protein
MSLTAKNEGEGNFELCPADTHHAVCYGVIDLGTQLNAKFNTSQHKCMLLWELPNARMESGKPFAVSRMYTVSLADKAHLRQHLQAWRGRPFTEEELNGFEIKKILGANCLVQVIHNKSGERTYANVEAVMALPKGINSMPPATIDAENALILYDMDNGEPPPETIPEWIRKIIYKSAEMSGNIPQETQSEAPPMEEMIEPF